jgi:hypothetical protein
MSFNEIAKIVSFFSFLGMLIIIFRKIPVLVSLPEIKEEGERKSRLSLLKEKIKKINPFKKISYETFLEKMVYKIRLLSLRTDNKTFQLLQDLKKKALEKKKRLDDNYWQEIKKKMRK